MLWTGEEGVLWWANKIVRAQAMAFGIGWH